MTLLSVEDIHTYYGDSHILHGVSLELEENDVVTLLGRNGAGKTTTLKSITGVQPPRRGRVVYRGEDITGLPIHDVSARGIKVVPEHRRVFPTLSVHENITTAARIADDPRPVEEMYELFPTLDPLRDNDGRNLSGGEQQMLAIARVLVQSPELLLLEEPSEGLAPVIVEDLHDIISDVVTEDVTVLMTEQNVNFAFDLAERAYIMDAGQVVYEGTIDELRAEDELLETYLALSS